MGVDEMTKADVRARYDGMAQAELQGTGAFEPLSRAKVYFRGRKLSATLAMGRFPAGSALLEIGCSVGQFTFPLAQQGHAVWGMDLSPVSVAVARQRAEAAGVRGVMFVSGDAEDLGQFPDGRFDGVVSFSTLRYVGDLPRALREIRRVLKPGGTAVLDFPNRWCPWFYLKPWLGSERHPHDHWFSASQVRRMVAEAGLRDVRVRHLLFTPTVTPDPLIGVFAALDWVGERIPLLNRLAGIIMVAAVRK